MVLYLRGHAYDILKYFLMLISLWQNIAGEKVLSSGHYRVLSPADWKFSRTQRRIGNILLRGRTGKYTTIRYRLDGPGFEISLLILFGISVQCCRESEFIVRSDAFRLAFFDL
ncbi:hypothetical protein AVEN_268228-1 [Araneus ventricosus]|uniref:Uncharacterized protein n=1 Tax=Araneus ventricosus TaxID=182803 RepID=A0A4Y2UEC0_ARAVE|nr:hypothetical protein AVEN_268228-1 [Araneus ventricosus]